LLNQPTKLAIFNSKLLVYQLIIDDKKKTLRAIAALRKTSFPFHPGFTHPFLVVPFSGQQIQALRSFYTENKHHPK
jgi:hypothetical protein